MNDSPEPQPTILERFGALLCLAAGIVLATGVGRALGAGWLPIVSLKTGGDGIPCTTPQGTSAETLQLFAAQSQWLATLVLEGFAALAAVGCALVTFVALGRQAVTHRDGVFVLLICVGIYAVARDVGLVWSLRTKLDAQGFLSQLLASLKYPSCTAVRRCVVWARMVGEPAAICAGVAMTGSAGFSTRPTPAELARRARALGQLLYAGSFLFVVGIMMSRANFVWVLAQWNVKDAAVAKALAEVVKAGVVQSGVGYSAILAAFFVPVRVLLDIHASAAFPEAAKSSNLDAASPNAKRRWLASHGLSGTWQEDARQILAVLAPVLAAPVFDAIAKS